MPILIGPDAAGGACVGAVVAAAGACVGAVVAAAGACVGAVVGAALGVGVAQAVSAKEAKTNSAVNLRSRCPIVAIECIAFIVILLLVRMLTVMDGVVQLIRLHQLYIAKLTLVINYGLFSPPFYLVCCATGF